MYCNFCALFKIKKFLQILWPFGFCFGCLNKVYRNSNTFFKTQTAYAIMIIIRVRILKPKLPARTQKTNSCAQPTSVVSLTCQSTLKHAHAEMLQVGGE